MRKILSIDDEPSMLHCLQSALERQGYVLVTTSDPDEGLEMLKNDPDICLALLDVKMPKKSGFEVCTRSTVKTVTHKTIHYAFNA